MVPSAIEASEASVVMAPALVATQATIPVIGVAKVVVAVATGATCAFLAPEEASSRHGPLVEVPVVGVATTLTVAVAVATGVVIPVVVQATGAATSATMATPGETVMGEPEAPLVVLVGVPEAVAEVARRLLAAARPEAPLVLTRAPEAIVRHLGIGVCVIFVTRRGSGVGGNRHPKKNHDNVSTRLSALLGQRVKDYRRRTAARVRQSFWANC